MRAKADPQVCMLRYIPTRPVLQSDPIDRPRMEAGRWQGHDRGRIAKHERSWTGVLATLPVTDIAQRCAEETDKYSRKLDNDPRFCFELLRRALAERVPDAFTHVYQIYERQVTKWVYQHRGFPLTGESAEYFTSAAFQSFYAAVQGAKFDRFPTLATLLSYLKTCVHTAVARHLRDSERDVVQPLDETNAPADAPNLSARVEARELWAHICRLLPDERDQLLARCSFVLGLKPRHICVAYRGYWNSERDVTVALYRIRRTLRTDPELAVLAGWGNENEDHTG